MTDLKRLAELPEGAELAPLFRAARAFEPAVGASDRALHHIELQLAASVAGTGPVAMLSSHTKVALAIGASLAVGGLLGWWGLSPDTHEPEVMPVAAPKSAAAPAPAGPAPAPSASAGEADDPIASPPVPMASFAARQPASRSTLAEEIAMMDRARRALAQGAPAEALRLLDEHARAFPQPTFGAEAQVTRLEALLAQGQRAQAMEFGRRLLKRQPRGVHAQRIRQLIGEPPLPSGSR